MSVSLRIGTDSIGWAEFGHEVQLGTLTRVMPGGDGALDFAIPGEAAWSHRHVIAPESEVVLNVGGTTVFGGYLTCDPLRHRLGAQDSLELVATGPWGMAARDDRYAYGAVEADLSRWFSVSTQYRAAAGEIGLLEDSGKFTVSVEGTLLIKAEGGRAFDDYAKRRLCYHLFDGLLTGAVIYGMDFKYKAYLPATYWKARISTADNPWAETLTMEWEEDADSSAWSATQTVDFTSPNAAVLLMLWWSSSGSNTPTTAPYIRLKDVVLYCRLNGAAVDRAVTIADILGDLATELGVTTTRITGLTTQVSAFMAPYPSTVRDALEAATLLEASPVEAYFDHTGSAFRFTANTRPTSVNGARNRLWSVGPRGGESIDGLHRDWEATPEQVEVLYAVKGETTVPDGLVKTAQYPATVTSSFPLVERIDLTSEETQTSAWAAVYAQSVYNARQASLYSGDVVLPDRALTSAGQEVETVRLRPGDRIGIPSLLDVPAAGLYVQATSYDFRSASCTATVGDPWDPLGRRPVLRPHTGHSPRPDRYKRRWSPV